MEGGSGEGDGGREGGQTVELMGECRETGGSRRKEGHIIELPQEWRGNRGTNRGNKVGSMRSIARGLSAHLRHIKPLACSG